MNGEPTRSAALAPAAAGAAESLGGRTAWVSVGTALTAGLFVYLLRYSLAVLVPDLVRAFSISAAQVGVLGSIYFWTYAPMQIPSGVLADRLGPRRSIAGFFIIAAAGALLFALAPNFGIVLLAGALGGFGVSVGYVCTARLIATWFPANLFGALIGGWTAIGSLGSLLAAVPLAWLIAHSGWRSSLAILGALLAIYAVAAYILVRDAPARTAHEAPRTVLSLRTAFAEVGRSRNTWLLGAYGFLAFGTMIVLQALWGITYLIDAYGMSRGHASAVLSLWSVGLLLGAPSAGYLADRVLRRRKLVVVWGTLAYAAVWLVLALRPSGLPEPLLWLLFLAGGLASAAWTPAIAQVKDSFSVQVVGTAVGAMNFAFFLGAAVLQPLSGLILGAFPRVAGHLSSAAYQGLFRAGLAVILLAVLCAAFSREQSPG